MALPMLYHNNINNDNHNDNNNNVARLWRVYADMRITANGRNVLSIFIAKRADDAVCRYHVRYYHQELDLLLLTVL